MAQSTRAMQIGRGPRGVVERFLPDDCGVLVAFSDRSTAELVVAAGLEPQLQKLVESYPGPLAGLTDEELEALAHSLKAAAVTHDAVPGLQSELMSRRRRARTRQGSTWTDAAGKALLAVCAAPFALARLGGCGVVVAVCFGLVLLSIAVGVVQALIEHPLIALVVIGPIMGASYFFSAKQRTRRKHSAWQEIRAVQDRHWADYQARIDHLAERLAPLRSEVHELSADLLRCERALEDLALNGLEQTGQRAELSDLLRSIVESWVTSISADKERRRCEAVLDGVQRQAIDTDEDLLEVARRRDAASAAQADSELRAKRDCEIVGLIAASLEELAHLTRAKLRAARMRHGLDTD